MAPMDDVTDFPYRQMVIQCGGPDVMFTEFVSADGMCSAGRKRLLYDLKFHENEKPIVAQVFGSNPANFYKSAKLIEKLGFDGIDINMGCPFKAIEKQGAGAALIKTPLLAKEIITATVDGAGEMAVSVKTRIGYNKDVSKSWIPKILEMKPAALIIHGRTQKEKSKVPAHWDIIKSIGAIVKASSPKTIFIGNGDVKSIQDAKDKAQEFGVDGVMIGRAAMNDPWFFSGKSADQITYNDRLQLLIRHSHLFEKTFKGIKNFYNIRKFYSSYVSDFTDSKKLRIELMKAQNALEVESMINRFLKQ
ncbi:tRNA-dihydrouridine synthase [Patescibacteria group bacterium]|nr:tRNA-dihydrouridine synthase [Patescibacteria group bacterium]